ncbi:Acetyltransferase pyr8 [Paramyrothecium foliicola]|nr:Acetyltransferase pyr8 [Paramyrothecium foliicola]
MTGSPLFTMFATPFLSGLHSPSISVSDSLLSIPELRNKVWDDLHRTVDQGIADGRAAPFLLPLALLGPLLLPLAWLTIPHARRPWLYNMRWLVAAAIVAVDLDLIRWARSPNTGYSYVVGLMAAWGVITTLNLVVWTRPQLEAARIIRRRKPLALAGDEKRSYKPGEPTPAMLPCNASRNEFEYVWQPFPEDGPLLDRISWATDLVVSFRGVGWNWATSSIPKPTTPREVRFGMPVDVDSIPSVSRSGYTRATSKCEFIMTRLINVAVMYLTLDLIGVSIVKDPYFILGPNTAHLPRSSCLDSLPSWALVTYRGIFTLVGIWCGVGAVTAINDIVQYYLLRNAVPRYGEFWMYPSTNGAISSLLDYGLAGFWGRVWHQSFRVPFSAPATYLVRQGFVKRDTALGATIVMFIAFIQSGFLHAAGSFTTVPENEPWKAMAFFVLQAVGILIQQSLAAIAGRFLPNKCQLVSRAINLAFTLAWLNVTGKLLADDLAAGGIWLMDPVPVSVFRLFGFGQPGEHWLRWNLYNFIRLHRGGQWWERGVVI